MNSARVSRLFHKRIAAGTMLLTAVLYLVLIGNIGADLDVTGDSGLGLPPVSAWGLNETWSMVLSAACNVALMALIVTMARTYNVLRAITWLPVGLFVLMQAAVPSDVLQLNSGTIAALDVAVGLCLMFSTYGRPSEVHTVYLTFMLLSAGAALEYAVAVYIPVFWVVCLQMRVFSLRCLSASLLGIVTPWILMLGFGLIAPDQIDMPRPGNIFEMTDVHSALYVLVVAGVTASMMVVLVVANVMKTLAYNARSRALNGALLVVAGATLVAAAFDADNIAAYLPLLNMSAAIQISHYFVNHPYERQYLGVLSVVGIFIILYLWRLTL